MLIKEINVSCSLIKSGRVLNWKKVNYEFYFEEKTVDYFQKSNVLLSVRMNKYGVLLGFKSITKL